MVYTMLHKTIAYKVVERFLELGVDINVIDHIGDNTPLHCASDTWTQRMYKFELLLKYGANPNISDE
jgi:ankyrin repeat protein